MSEQLGSLLKTAAEEYGFSMEFAERAKHMSVDEWSQWQADTYNESEGTLHERDGYHCSLCKNRGDFQVLDENKNNVTRYCTCIGIRETLRREKQSGLGQLLTDCTFDKYVATQGWQKDAKTSAQRFCTDENAAWFYIGGSVGSGKTHLCTAIAGYYIKKGKKVRYMLWAEDAKRIKAAINDEATYRKLLAPFKNTEVLYIDDFLKTRAGEKPSAGDINVAFELIDCRYRNSDKITIISSEKVIKEVIDADEATGSRISQRAGAYKIAISADPRKNYRLNQ